MGWTRPSRHIIRAFAAVLLFAGPQRFRRNRCEVGAFLLQLCATRNHGRPMFMPDMPSLALSIIGLYFFQRWIEESARESPARSTSFFVAAIAISLSILIKLPSILIGAPLACLAFQRFSIPPLRLGAAFRNLSLWSFGALALLPSALWYGHAYQIALQFYPHHFFGAGGVQIMSAAWYLKIVKQIVTSTLTPFVFNLGSVGVLVTRTCPDRQTDGSIPRPRDAARTFRWWLAAMILFIVIVGYGNRHQW